MLVDRIRHRLVSTAGSSDDPALASIVRDEAAVLADDVVLAELRREVAAELAGAGPLEQLLEIARMTDVLVNGPSEVWLDRGFGMERAAADISRRRCGTPAGATAGGGRRAPAGRRQPFVDATLPDGTRLHAVLPPITAHPTISLRVLRRRRFTLAAAGAPGRRRTAGGGRRRPPGGSGERWDRQREDDAARRHAGDGHAGRARW